MNLLEVKEMNLNKAAEQLAEKAWKNLGQIYFCLIGTMRVGFSIEKEGEKYHAILSFSCADVRRQRELVRIFFGSKKTRKMKGMFCTMYAEYDMPKDA